jgi:hypothetical protein
MEEHPGPKEYAVGKRHIGIPGVGEGLGDQEMGEEDHRWKGWREGESQEGQRWVVKGCERELILNLVLQFEQLILAFWDGTFAVYHMTSRC